MRRNRLAFTGVLLAAAMAGAAVTVGYGLATGFDRAARAGRPARRDRPLPRPSARRDRRDRRRAAERRRSLLPPRAAGVGAGGRGGSSEKGAWRSWTGRRGYAIVDGRDVSGRPNEVVIDRGVANEWTWAWATRSTAGASARARRGDRGRARQRRVPTRAGPADVRLARVARARAGRALSGQPGADLGREPRPGRRALQQARATSTQIRACASSPEAACGCSSTRRPGS